MLTILPRYVNSSTFSNGSPSEFYLTSITNVCFNDHHTCFDVHGADVKPRRRLKWNNCKRLQGDCLDMNTFDDKFEISIEQLDYELEISI